MPHPAPDSTPSNKPVWDISFTRLTQAMRPRMDACSTDLARKFQAIGLESQTDIRQTPRGVSSFLALVGQRGLVCIVDITLVDGMAVGLGACAALEVRLLDACGDVVVDAVPHAVQGQTFSDACAALLQLSENLSRTATAVYVAALGHFSLLKPVTP